MLMKYAESTGRTADALAARTCGIVCSASRILRYVSDAATPLRPASPASTENISTLRRSYPVSCDHRFCIVRRKSPANTTSTSDTATWVATRHRRSEEHTSELQ